MVEHWENLHEELGTFSHGANRNFAENGMQELEIETAPAADGYMNSEDPAGRDLVGAVVCDFQDAIGEFTLVHVSPRRTCGGPGGVIHPKVVGESNGRKAVFPVKRFHSRHKDQ